MGDSAEDRRKVLEMLAAGQISVDETERLLRALGEPPVAAPGAADALAKPAPRYLRVLITDGGDGAPHDQVNVRVPLQLIRAGVKLGALLPPEAVSRIDSKLADKNIPLDLANLSPETLDEFVAGLSDLTVEVADGQSSVRVFCE